MNKLKTIRETKLFLDDNYDTLFKIFCELRNGKKNPKTLKKIKKSFKCLNGFKDFSNNLTILFIDNTAIARLDNLLFFQNFVLTFTDPIVLLCEADKHKRFKITSYKNSYFIPIEEFNLFDGDYYCYTKPSRGQIGLRTEHDLQNYLINLIETLDGWEYERLSPRKYGNGVPDLKVKKPDKQEMFIELKSPQRTGRLTMDQIEFHEKLRDQGELVKVFWKKEQVDDLLAGRI